MATTAYVEEASLEDQLEQRVEGLPGWASNSCSASEVWTVTTAQGLQELVAK